MEKIFNDYQSAKNEKYVKHPLVNLIQKDFPKYLQDLTSKMRTYKIISYSGQGKWTSSPYIVIFDPEITTGFESGFYVIYILSEDTKRFYLSLNQGIGNINKLDSKELEETLRMKATNFRNNLIVPEGFEINDLSGLGGSYYYKRIEYANICSKTYTIDNLPSEEELESDLNEILKLYKDLTSNIPKVWQITPGSVSSGQQDKLWPLFRDEGFIGIGWLHDSRSYLEFESIAELKEALIEFYPKYKETDPSQAASMVWNFTHNIKKGDIIIANAGYPRINGIGIVTSNYIDPTNHENPGIFDYFWHLRKIDWKITDELELNKKIFYRQTIVELDEIKWNDIKNAYNEKNPEYADVFKEMEGSFKTNKIRQYIEKIAKNQSNYPFDEEELNNILNEFSSHLKGVTGDNYSSEISTNRNIPHIIFNIPNSNFYILYIVPENKKGIYLSLNHGIFAMRDNLSGNGPKMGLKAQNDINIFIKKALNHIEILRAKVKQPVNFSPFMDLNAKKAISGQLYEACSIYSRFYIFDNLPPEEEIENDFKEIFKIYTKLISTDNLRFIGDKNDILGAQKKFETILRNNATEIIKSSSTKSENILYLSEFGIWTSSGENPNSFFNIFGIGNPASTSAKTTVEINIPYVGIHENTSGAFAKDDSGEIYLLHRGKLHGNILTDENYDGEWLEVADNDSKRKLIVIGGLNEPDFLEKLKNFVFDIHKIKLGDDKLKNLNFFEFLSKEGYFFDPKIVENYLLSLKVKPFVILTGNSGTGKTKVAQLFAKYLNSKKVKKDSIDDPIIIKNPNKVKSRYLSANDYIIKNHGGWALKTDEIKYLKGFFEDFTLATYDPVNKKIQTGQGHITNNKLFCTIDTPFFDFLKSIKHDFKTIYFIKEKYKPEINLNEYLIKIDDKYGEKYKIVPVGANWTENRHIIGFHNVITEEYNETSALNLILKARKDGDEPYFLILDEMNLSHVERYFSDFLSAMESNEDIELHSNDDLTTPPSKIKLSSNLFVIGTVNVDETTYMFSPKVLDRANTLEFLTQPAADYMSNSPKYNVKGNIDYLLNPLSDVELRDENINNLKNTLINVQTQNNLLWDLLASRINEFQDVLKEADFDFGFRTINEIIRFMIVSWKYEGQPDVWDNWERYFDSQILQKMLPKLHGSQRELDSVLKNLRELCGESDKIIFPCSAQKLDKMLKRLSEKRYVAFTG